MIDNSMLVVDGKKYLVVDTITSGDIKYVYFVNEDNDSDFFVRKEITENNQKYLVGLDNDQEYINAMQLFTEKNKKK